MKQPTSILRHLACLLCLSGLLLLAAACARSAGDPLAPGSVVLVLGDSISAGYRLSPEDAWPARLAERTGWVVVNGGVSGDTTGEARARLPGLLDAHRPALVIVELGGNDMLRRAPLSDAQANLEAIIADIRTAGARPVLMAIPQPSIAGAVFQSLSDAPLYADLAAQLKVPLMADVVSEVLSDPALKLDQLHPNAEGSRVLAERAAKALRKLGLLS